ncbi:hypothetical protein GCM10020255_107750 [Rhodococcus baikonurensis]
MTGLIAASTSAADKRIAFRAGLTSGKIQRLPGAINPLTAKLIQEIGFEGVYVSGGAYSAGLALPDIGLTTLTEVAAHSKQIARVTDLPTLIDADTGFGEPMSAARTVTIFEDDGIAGLHLEDQINPSAVGTSTAKRSCPPKTWFAEFVLQSRHVATRTSSSARAPMLPESTVSTQRSSEQRPTRMPVPI